MYYILLLYLAMNSPLLRITTILITSLRELLPVTAVTNITTHYFPGQLAEVCYHFCTMHHRWKLYVRCGSLCRSNLNQAPLYNLYIPKNFSWQWRYITGTCHHTTTCQYLQIAVMLIHWCIRLRKLKWCDWIPDYFPVSKCSCNRIPVNYSSSSQQIYQRRLFPSLPVITYVHGWHVFLCRKRSGARGCAGKPARKRWDVARAIEHHKLMTEQETEESSYEAAILTDRSLDLIVV